MAQGDEYMNWKEAKIEIEGIKIGADINTTRSTYREVTGRDKSITSKRYGYEEEKGFIIQIGDVNYIRVPYSMLESCFMAMKTKDGYNGTFFRNEFPLQAQDHGCHVHSIGMLFVKAGIAVKKGNSYFLI